MRTVSCLTGGIRASGLVMLLGLLCLQAGTAQGQLRVLSKGNPVEEWRKAQLAQLDKQLADKATTGPLKLELEAQKGWLVAYTPGQLSPQPSKPSVKSSSGPAASGRAGESPSAIDEPTIDPDEKAAAIRKKLFGPKARPTSADTEALRKALEKTPDDIGLRQLQLHWLDQPQYRDEYPLEIADAAARLIGLVEVNKKINSKTKEAVIAMTLYRQARALGYRLDPDVVAKKPLEPGEKEKVDAQLVGTYSQLIKLVGPGRPEFALLEIRMLRRDNWFGRALETLERNAGQIEARWYLEKRRDLLRDLGWKSPADQAHEMFAAAFPEEAKKFP